MATKPAPRAKLLPEAVSGHVVGWFPGSRMIFAEGHPDPDGLCDPADLVAVRDQLEAGLRDRGILPPTYAESPWHKPAGMGMTLLPVVGGTGFGGVRRLDSTVDLGFERPEEGLAALTGVAALPLPRMKSQVIREVGGRRVETVYFRGSAGKKVLGRWYDKGVESGRAARGLLIRPEDQRRFTHGHRLTVEAVAEGTYVRDAFVRRFEPLWCASKGVLVAGIYDLTRKLADLQDEGVLTPSQAERLAGYLLLDSAEACRSTGATRWRRRQDLRANGLVLADGVLEEVEVDLQAVLERAFDSEAWGAQG